MHASDAVLARLIDQVDSARAQRAPLEIRGGGTKRFYGEAPAGTPLDVTELSGISSYEPTELVVTARAGTRLEDLEAALQEHGQCLPFEPPRFAQGSTVGGMVAAGLSGPARASVGSVRDHVLGVTLLNGRSEVLTFGGQVSKNVAGYDVSRLLVGSLGILGIICDVSMKVLPVSVATTTLTFDWDEQQALEKLGRWAGQPWPINATAWHSGRLYVRLAGARAAVSAACERLGGGRMETAAANAWWLSVRDQSAQFFSLEPAGSGRGESLWRLSVPAVAAALLLPGQQFIEWGGAQRWWRTTAPAAEVRDAATRAGGHATLIRGADRSHVFAPLNSVLMRVHHGLKKAFDPDGIFNPGRLYAGL
ncbi:MAG TPA: glycolate oxidase subunit GlcE [Steroidobacteraceae bacterium]|jgi:FAD/FMN-containing dehydrogenase|nr:glycolate oxidase subunit GlcE [Steroidobacteraceae bacterium]